MPKLTRPFKLLAMAERPGLTELRKGFPLAGRSGWRLWKTLEEHGITEPEVWTDNSTLCTWREYVTDGAWNKAVRACSPRAARRIKQLADDSNQKLLVLLLGGKSLRSVSKHESIDKWGGFPLLPDSIRPEFAHPNAVYFPTYHPSRVLREPFLLPVFRLDVARAVAYASGNLSAEAWPRISTGCGEPVEEWLRQALVSADEGLLTLGLDIETAGKEPLLVPTICVGLADEDSAVSFPLGRSSVVESLFRRVYQHPNITFVLQNGNHDTLGLECAGFGLPANVVDILNAARVLFPSIAHDLQSLIRYFMFIEKHKLMYKDDKGSDVFKEALKDESKLARLLNYNAKDAWTQLQVWLRMHHMLDGEV